MNVLLFTLEYSPFHGGVANYYENIVRHWPAEKIFVLDNNDGELLNNDLPFLKWLPAVRELFKAVSKEKIEHIIVGHILPLGTAALIINKILKTPYSVILHGMDLTLALKAGRKRWLAKKILNSAENIICASNFTAESASRVVRHKEKIKVVNPGADIHITHNMERITNLKMKYGLENKIILFSIGRLVRRKGFDKVIEAMPEVLKEAPNLIYAIAGTGPDEEYLKKLATQCHCEKPVAATSDEAISASSKNVDDRYTILSLPKIASLCPAICGAPLAMTHNITFLGKISDEEKWTWFDLCDIFIMPARQISNDFEGFGIVYLEANLAGKPVIAGRSGGVEDAVLDNETGLLVNPESAAEIANAIIKLARDKELREKLGENGKKRAEEEFNWGKQINKIYNIIKSPFLIKGDMGGF